MSCFVANFANDQISIRINDKLENITFKPQDPFSFEAVTPLQSQSILQQSATPNDTDITDKEHLIEKKTPQIDYPFSFVLALIINPSTSEKYIDSEKETASSS